MQPDGVRGASIWEPGMPARGLRHAGALRHRDRPV